MHRQWMGKSQKERLYNLPHDSVDNNLVFGEPETIFRKSNSGNDGTAADSKRQLQGWNGVTLDNQSLQPKIA